PACAVRGRSHDPFFAVFRDFPREWQMNDALSFGSARICDNSILTSGGSLPLSKLNPAPL
ncbi:MAG TPA: hypothetical protein VMW05_03065, partial [Methyloceanibacter sp.]|nr:hypothetical protein [Methyloceanibacter sp.]